MKAEITSRQPVGVPVNDEILTRAEAADFLKLPQRTLDYLIATNQVPYSRCGKRVIRFRRDRLLKWLEEREGVVYRISKGE